MKYLHSGYILLCEAADHAADGRVNTTGLFDLFVVDNFPFNLKCVVVVGFGTPYERRQYKGHLEIEDPSGRTIFTQDFNANDLSDLLRGHAIFSAQIPIDSAGCFTFRCSLYNWKNENVWEVSRQLWAMLTPHGDEETQYDEAGAAPATGA